MKIVYEEKKFEKKNPTVGDIIKVDKELYMIVYCNYLPIGKLIFKLINLRTNGVSREDFESPENAVEFFSKSNPNVEIIQSKDVEIVIRNGGTSS